MKSVPSWVTQAVAWFVIFAAGSALAAAVVVPRVAGATPYTILTGSMRPSLPPGTLVAVKPKPVDELKVGDVVTYQLKSGEPTVVTHRITQIGTNLKGEMSFTTKGDANNVADANPVQPEQIRGELLYAVPKLGYVNNFINGNQRQVATYVVVTGLLGYAAFMSVATLRDRRKTKQQSGVTK